jgi:hypothetical protein
MFECLALGPRFRGDERKGNTTESRELFVHPLTGFRHADISSQRSRHRGFICSISFSFQARFQFLICLSRIKADSRVSCCSYQTSVLTPYSFVNPGTAPVRCCQTRRTRSSVIPVSKRAISSARQDVDIEGHCIWLLGPRFRGDERSMHRSFWQNETNVPGERCAPHASPISRRISAVCSPSRGEGRGDATGLPPIMIGVRTPGILPSLAASLASSSRMPRWITCGSANT